MPAAHLLGMICTGHTCWPPRPNVQASPNVTVNGIKWHRQTDKWMIHCCKHKSHYHCHSSVLAKGSSTVYVNNLQAGREGDPVACGSYAVGGSPNVYAGG